MTGNQPNNFSNKLDKLLQVMSALKFTDDIELAKAIGYSQGYISEILNKKKGVPKTMGQRLEDKLRINRKWFDLNTGEMFLRKEENNSHNVDGLNMVPYPSGDNKSNNLVAEKAAEYHVTTIIEPEPTGIPMFNFPSGANSAKIVGESKEINIVGYLNIPGADKKSFALPVLGQAMNPTLPNGSWGIVRPIDEKHDIEWGQIYWVEYGDYKVWKRLLKDEQSQDNVILWSDNQHDKINNQPTYAAKTIKTDRIQKLCLLTDILYKPNY